jgi:hypothetical protein
MIPGKQYTPEILLQIVWRHKWRIVLPFLVMGSDPVVDPTPFRLARFLDGSRAKPMGHV